MAVINPDSPTIAVHVVSSFSRRIQLADGARRASAAYTRRSMSGMPDDYRESAPVPREDHIAAGMHRAVRSRSRDAASGLVQYCPSTMGEVFPPSSITISLTTHQRSLSQQSGASLSDDVV